MERDDARVGRNAELKPPFSMKGSEKLGAVLKVQVTMYKAILGGEAVVLSAPDHQATLLT